MNTFTPEDHAPLPPLLIIPACQRRDAGADWFPAVDILEDDGEYLFKFDLPDVLPENIQVYVEGDGLLISGERLGPLTADKKCLRIERPQGHFERRFALPEDANRAEIDSTFQDGILELHVHKVRPVPPNPASGEARPKLRLCQAA
jgi:HSP20 family molecular chaperone IbpA